MSMILAWSGAIFGFIGVCVTIYIAMLKKVVRSEPIYF